MKQPFFFIISYIIQVIKSSKQELGIELELDEDQRRNFKKIIKRERELIETTPQLQQPLFFYTNSNG